MICDWLYPRRCACCDDLLPRTDRDDVWGCCDFCSSKKFYVPEPTCYCCGKPVVSDTQEYCDDCVKFPKQFNCNRSVFLYKDEIKDSLMRFKYKNRGEYADFYAKEILKRYGSLILRWNVDAILPVPVHPKKKRIRGYNQAELIAKALGKHLEISVVTDCLRRSEFTVAQKKLTPIERLKNLENAFQFHADSVKLKQVVVVDDIYTTGATLEACSRILRKHGVMEVYGITVAIGEGY